jgi:16S rRNA (cytidine1402-2'-O)-methyltransferase
MLFLLPTVLAPGTARQVLTPQVLDVLGRVDHFFAENLRTTRRFLSELKLGRPIESLHAEELSKDTPPSHVRKVLKHWHDAGHDVGVLSEAGCPGVADPGAVAVRLAHELGIRVVPLVGPSSLLLALMASGLNGQSFAFHGYLPIDRADRAQRVRHLEKAAWQHHQTQLFIETPYRNGALLDDLLAYCQPTTLLCIAANLTADDEFVKTQSIAAWRSQKPDLHKKPTVFLLGAP